MTTTSTTDGNRGDSQAQNRTQCKRIRFRDLRLNTCGCPAPAASISTVETTGQAGRRNGHVAALRRRRSQRPMSLRRTARVTMMALPGCSNGDIA